MTEKTADKKIEEMFSKGAHFGYSSSMSHPKMKPFIFTSRNGVELFDLEKTKVKLDEAKDFIKKIGSEKGLVLFVGTKKEISSLVEKQAKTVEMPFVIERWLGGTITNFSEIKKRLDHLKDLVEKMKTGAFKDNTKKERLMIDEKILKMRRYFDGIENLSSVPKLLVVIDTKKEKIAVAEARKRNIPIIGLMSSDCNPKDADYVIPANDSSVTSVDYFLGELVGAYGDGVKAAPVKVEEKEAPTSKKDGVQDKKEGK